MTSSFYKEKLTPYPVVRLPKDEDKRQKIRKDRILSSRFMDNSYDPTIHQKFFKPGGLYILKK